MKANVRGKLFLRRTPGGRYIVAGVLVIPEGQELPSEATVECKGSLAPANSIDILGAMAGGEYLSKGRLDLTIDLSDPVLHGDRFTGCHIDQVLTSFEWSNG